MKSDLYEMLEAIKTFHQKNGFDIGTKSRVTMLYRNNLLIEELGEIASCLTKGESKERLAEEHADLFILLLGNCITMNIDLTEAFWKKYDKIMQREGKSVGNQKRVSDWKKG